MNILLVSSHGNPSNSGLWSGTPANLLRSLKESGVVEVETMFTLKYKFVDSILIAIEILFGLRLRRSKFRRFVTSKFLYYRLFTKIDIFSHVLFFDIEGSPKVLRKRHLKTKMYRLLDSTETQWNS